MTQLSTGHPLAQNWPHPTASPAERRRILVAGYYGFGNAGDEAILQETLRELRDLRPDLEVVVVSGNPEATATTHHVAAVLFTDIAALSDAVARADVVLVGGGGLFHDHFGFDPDTVLSPAHGGLALFAGVALLAALFDKPLMILGAGVGPLRSAEAREYTRFVFNHSRIATVRDRASSVELAAAGVTRRIRVVPDPAFGLELADDTRTRQVLAGCVPDDHPLVGVAIRNWDRSAAWEIEVAAALDEFLDAHVGCALLVPLQDLEGSLVDDRAIALRVQSRMRHGARTGLVPPSCSPSVKAALLARCRVVLAMRLHAMIFALRAGVPPVSIAYDPKVRSLAQDAGVADLAIPIDDITRDGIADRLECALRNRDEMSARLAADAARRARAARINARLAVTLLAARPRRRRDRDDTVEMFKRTTVALMDALARSRDEDVRSTRRAADESARHSEEIAWLKTEVAALTAQVRARDEGIAWLRSEVRKRDEHVDELAQKIAGLDEAQLQRSRTLAERDARIDALRRSIGDRDEQIAALARSLDERNETIRALALEAHERGLRLDRCGDQIRAHEDGIAWLREQVRLRADTIDTLTRQVGSRDEGVTWLREEVCSRDERIALLTEQVRVRDEGIAWLRDELDAPRWSTGWNRIVALVRCVW